MIIRSIYCDIFILVPNILPYSYTRFTTGIKTVLCNCQFRCVNSFGITLPYSLSLLNQRTKKNEITASYLQIFYIIMIIFTLIYDKNLVKSPDPIICESIPLHIVSYYFNIVKSKGSPLMFCFFLLLFFNLWRELNRWNLSRSCKIL